MQRNLVSLAYSTVFRVLALSFWDSPNQTHGCREFPLGQHVAPTFRGAPVMYPLWFSGSHVFSYFPVALLCPSGHFLRPSL